MEHKDTEQTVAPEEVVSINFIEAEINKELESGKYVKSGAGCDGQCGGSESSAKHYYRGMGRNRLHQSADGFYFRPPIPLFL